jgi:thiosulfate/3-mercaptopyruvate sulfurtransferase
VPELSPVIGVRALRKGLSDPALRLADVRWYLSDQGRGRREYQAAHLPGAVFVDLETCLSASHGPGRHPLPGRADFAAAMGDLGIGDDSLVVAYDDVGGTIAARLWWMLRDVGHKRVQVLDGGLPAWVEAGLPLAAEVPTWPPATLTVQPGPTASIYREDLVKRLGKLTLLDARAPVRYRGEDLGPDPVAGHIPTAISVPCQANLDAAGRMLDPETLRARFQALGVGTGDTVVYCGSGVTACHNVLAIVSAGLPEPLLYPGSWSDWSSAGMPVVIGPDPGTQ